MLFVTVLNVLTAARACQNVLRHRCQPKSLEPNYQRDHTII